jgi:hypothetical protein
VRADRQRRGRERRGATREPPSLKVTVPVGVPPVTVAVKVTAWPNVLGLGEDVSAVADVVWLTVCVTAGDVLPV